MLLSRAGRLRDAAGEFAHAARLRPDDFDARLNAARALLCAAAGVGAPLGEGDDLPHLT